MSRFLTKKEKKKELAELEKLYPWANDLHNNGLDIKMIPFLKELNTINGLVTTQSCQGHKNCTYISAAQLWVRLSNTMYQLFFKYLNRLLKCKYIKVVDTNHYQFDERKLSESIDIIMDPYHLDEVMKHIVHFFKFLERSNNV